MDFRACCCVGKQNGEPHCPCKMRDMGLFKRDGRWIKPAEPEKDMGAVSELSDYLTEFMEKQNDK